MIRNCPSRKFSSPGLLCLGILILGVILGPSGATQEQDESSFRLSGAKRESGAESGKPETSIEVNSDDSAASPENPGTESVAPGVVTGVVEKRISPEEPASGAAEGSDIRLPKGRDVPSSTGQSSEVAAGAGFRLSARPEPEKPEPVADEPEPDEASRLRALMGPPDPSELPEGDRQPSETGSESVGRAVTARYGEEGESPDELSEPESSEPESSESTRLEPEPGDRLLAEENSPLHPGPEMHSGQQGNAYTSSDAAHPETNAGASERVETWSDGYFPTQNDNFYLGDLDYPRGRIRTGGGSGPGTVSGLGPGPSIYQPTDYRSIAATGLFPYEHPEETFYDRHSYVFGPLDRALGLIAPHDALVVEGDRLQGFSASLDGRFPTFTNRFNPDKAHFKAGPFYLDLLSIGAGVLYSDFRGREGFPPFREGEEDGWLGYIDIDVRALLQITNNFYLSASTRLMYLPGSNRVAWQLGYGSRPFLHFRLNYENTFGHWDLLAYNDFRGQLGVDIWNEVGSGAGERAGRYYFGIPVVQNQRYSFFDEGAVVFINSVGARATRALNEDWRLWLRGDRADFWQGWNFVDHNARHHWGSTIGYEGAHLPFSPYFSYDGYHFVNQGSVYHHARVGGRGRLTENLSINATGGYLWTNSMDPDHDQFTWRVGLNHDLNERIRHGVSGGQYFFVNDLYDDAAVSDYISYYLNVRLAEQLYGRAYAQWADEELLTGDGIRRKRDMYGAYLNYRPGMSTSIRGGAYYQETRTSDGTFLDDRWIYYGMVTQRVFSRLSVWFRYQFDESNFYDEHLYAAGVRRYF